MTWFSRKSSTLTVYIYHFSPLTCQPLRECLNPSPGNVFQWTKSTSPMPWNEGLYLLIYYTSLKKKKIDLIIALIKKDIMNSKKNGIYVTRHSAVSDIMLKKIKNYTRQTKRAGNSLGMRSNVPSRSFARVLNSLDSIRSQIQIDRS